MKKFILFFLTLFFSANIFAQTNQAGKPPSATNSTTTNQTSAVENATTPTTEEGISTEAKANEAESYGLNSVSAETIGVINWNDTMETTKANLEEKFGEASIDGENVSANGLFGGEPSKITCIYEGGALSRVEFKILFEGEGKNAYIGYENANATLMEMFGSPNSIDVYSGERLWKFGDGGVVKVLNKRSQKEAKRKNVGTISGEGELTGQLRTQGREGGKTEGKFLLNLNKSKNAEGLIWDGEQTYTITELETTILFVKDSSTLSPIVNDSVPADATNSATTPANGNTTTSKPNATAPAKK